MTLRVLYLPGLDGIENVPGKLQSYLRGVELVPFTYPTGHRLTWEELTDLVSSRLRNLKSGMLVGESFGGAVALKTTFAKPEAVKGLCLVAGFSANPEPFAAGLGSTATRVLPKPLMKPVARLLAGWKLAGTLKGEARTRFLERFSNLDYHDIAARLDLLQKFDVEDRLGALRCPVDLIYGSEDPIASSRRQRELWTRIPDVRQHQLDSYGHLISHEVPIGVAARLQSWVERVKGRCGN